MKILLLSPQAALFGTEKHVLALAAGLRRLGDQAEVVVPCRGELVDKLSEAGIPVHVTRWRGSRVIGLARLMRLVYVGRYDIVHTHAYSRLPCLAARLVRTGRTVETRHVAALKETGLHGASRLRWLDRLLDRCCDAVIGGSTEVRDEAIRRDVPPEKIHVIRYGVSLPQIPQDARIAVRQAVRIGLGLEEACVVVGAVARLSEQKGLSFLIRAAALLQDRPSVRFAIVGDGDQRGKLEELRRELRLERKVLLCGYRRDLAELLCAFDILAIPSLFEGMPLILPEAMASGLPVVASSLDSLREAEGKSGAAVFVPPRNAHALAASLRELIDDPERRREMAAAGRARSGCFRVDAMVEEIRRLYRGLAERREIRTMGRDKSNGGCSPRQEALSGLRGSSNRRARDPGGREDPQERLARQRSEGEGFRRGVP
ncbi:MAG: glycosyltransferase [bacterium]